MFPRLHERRASHARSLSGGEQRMLSIGIALMTQPRVLLIDEPSAGLAPSLVDDVMAQLAVLNREWNSTILLVEQNVRAGLTIATSVLGVRLGTISGRYNAADIRDRDEILTLL
jgi:branched-chain amino acid transport system ATP-binding protein